MTEFKQDNLTFVDVVPLVFLVILFISNFFGLLYFASGSFLISIAISTLVVVLYYAIIQLPKKSKQRMVTQLYKSLATILLVLFVVLAIFNFVPLTHLVNIETNAKDKVQVEVNEKINKVNTFSGIYANRAKTDIQNFGSQLIDKLRAYVKSKNPTLKNQLMAAPYSIDAQVLATPRNIDVDDLVASRLIAVRSRIQDNQQEIDKRVNEANDYQRRFQQWNRLRVATEYKNLNTFVTDSYKLLNKKLSELPVNKTPESVSINKIQLPLDSFTELNRQYPPNWLLPALAVVIIHLFILIPFFLYRVRVYRNDTDTTSGKVIEY